MNKLRIIFWCVLAIELAGIALMETNEQLSGLLSISTEAEYALISCMEISALVSIPTLLKLFKFNWVRKQLESGDQRAWLGWTLFRMSVMLLLVMANTALYYTTINTTFGYLALIHAVCLPFVYPQEEPTT